MFKVLYLLLIVCNVYRQTQQCCFPKQWKTRSYFSLGYQSGHSDMALASGYVDWFFDAVGQRIRLDSNSTTHLLLYKENVAYAIADNKCTKSKPGPWTNDLYCIPNSATITGKYRLGLKPSINVVDFSWSLKTKQQITLSVTNECVPVGRRQYMNSGDRKLLEVDRFGDFTLGIQDPKVFDVPEICKHAHEVEGHQKGILLGNVQ